MPLTLALHAPRPPPPPPAHTQTQYAVTLITHAQVYFHKTSDDPDDYLVDHSIITYLIDPAGEFVTFYGACGKITQLEA